MDIHGFGEALRQKITAVKLGARFADERSFESGVLVDAAWELARKNPEIRVFTHPWSRRAKCRPNCHDAVLDFNGRVEGCPDCWRNSKARSVTDVFGTRNNFDLAAIDRDNGSLVVEVKWLSVGKNRGPNSEFQRFIGQCTLAAAANDVVIGVCGLWGQRQKALEKHEARLQNAVRKIGVQLIVLRGETR